MNNAFAAEQEQSQLFAAEQSPLSEATATIVKTVNATSCQHCKSPQSTIKIKISCQKHNCQCNILVECICESFQNNELHWAVLSYVKGFKYRKHYNYYFCNCCDDSQQLVWCDFTLANIHLREAVVDKKNILKMIADNPNLLWEKNICGITPISLINVVIDILRDTSINASHHEQIYADVLLSLLSQVKREVASMIAKMA